MVKQLWITALLTIITKQLGNICTVDIRASLIVNLDVATQAQN